MIPPFNQIFLNELAVALVIPAPPFDLRKTMLLVNVGGYGYVDVP